MNNNWKTEFQINYQILKIEKGQKVIEHNKFIMEANNYNEAKKIICFKFKNVLGFKVDQIKKLWSY